MSFLFINEHDALVSSKLYNYTEKITFKKTDVIKNLQFKLNYYDFIAVCNKLKKYSIEVKNNIIDIDEDVYENFKDDVYFTDMIQQYNLINIKSNSFRQAIWKTNFQSTPSISNHNNFYKVYYQNGVSQE